MEQSLVHGLKFAPSQHCSSSDFTASDLILTALFNFLFINVGEIIVHFTKLYFSDQLMKKTLTSKVHVASLFGSTVYSLVLFQRAM